MAIQISSTLSGALAFLETHVIYWVILVALVFEARYLFHRKRREAIAMSRLGEASRRERPGYFYFLWILHVVVSSFFALMFISYVADLW